MSAEDFSPDYPMARARFRAAARSRGFALESHPLVAKGPAGEELTIDVALSPDGAGPCSRAVVVSSGLHGLEGFFGSAVQLRFLDGELPARPLPEGTRLVLLHAVNPYGFAHGRRANEDNVDLNRNFRKDGEAYSGAPDGYADVDALINPRTPPGALELFLPRAIAKRLWFLARRRDLRAIVASGQYDFPGGLFYGGSCPSQSARIVMENLERWLGDSRSVIHVDLHTGLGAWGTHSLLVTKRSTSAHWGRFVERVPDAGRLEVLAECRTAYSINGGFGDWCEDRFGTRGYDFVTAEFGTYWDFGVLAALRGENRAHHRKDADLPAWRARQREIFAPADPEWRRRVVGDGVAIVRAALDAVSGTRS